MKIKRMFSGADGKKLIILAAAGILGIALMIFGSSSLGKKAEFVDNI